MGPQSHRPRPQVGSAIHSMGSIESHRFCLPVTWGIEKMNYLARKGSGLEQPLSGKERRMDSVRAKKFYHGTCSVNVVTQSTTDALATLQPLVTAACRDSLVLTTSQI